MIALEMERKKCIKVYFGWDQKGMLKYVIGGKEGMEEPSRMTGPFTDMEKPQEEHIWEWNGNFRALLGTC